MNTPTITGYGDNTVPPSRTQAEALTIRLREYRPVTLRKHALYVRFRRWGGTMDEGRRAFKLSVEDACLMETLCALGGQPCPAVQPGARPPVPLPELLELALAGEVQ